EPKNLTVEESAVLVGMLQAPSKYNPRFHPERAQKRRNVVLGQMVKNEFLEEAAKDILAAKPIKLNYKPQSHKEGIATYFREYLRDFLKTWSKNNKRPDGTDYDIYRDGLRIYTTIDSRMQGYAEDAVSKHMANLQQEFFIDQKKNKNAPFVRLSEQETTKLMNNAIRNSDRWRLMSAQDISEED